jgi:threonine 3-dehydrogenase
MSILITGGAGFIGVGLARRLLEKGEDVVLFDIAIAHQRIADIKDKVKVIQGDLKVWNEVLNAVKDNKVHGIFHLGSMLSLPSEENPWAAFQTNVCGTFYVFEAARLFGVEKVVFASTAATYGSGTGEVIGDDTLQRPITMYGSCKLYGELLGRFYRRKFGLDFRSLRYCAVMGPGVKTIAVTQFYPWMVENAALGKPFECFAAEDAAVPVTYFKDAIRAIEMLYYAPKENIKTVVYNIAGVSPARTAKELEMSIRKFIPDAKITYKPDKVTMEFFRSQTMKVFDDTNARKEWGWKAEYTDFDKVVEDFIKEVKTRPKFYGLS